MSQQFGRRVTLRRRNSKLVDLYVIKAVLPYALLSVFLLSAVLFAQQADRFADPFLDAQIPLFTVLEIELHLLPTVLLFTIPMAVLAGAVIGFSRMGTDSELVAMRAAGVGTWNILRSVLLISLCLAAFTAYVGMTLAPRSLRALKQAALNAALYKLNSPVDARVFNTEIPASTIYVRDEDKVNGQWGRIFIYSQERDGRVRVVTARTGRIDLSSQHSEIVLTDTLAIDMPAQSGEHAAEISLNRSGQARRELTLLTLRRNNLFNTMQGAVLDPEELGWGELVQRARIASGPDGLKASIVMHRRLVLAAAPILLGLLGAGLGLRVKRGGRGFGALLSVVAMTVYYLLSLAGETMVRGGHLRPLIGMWSASLLILLLGIALIITSERPAFSWMRRTKRVRTAAPKRAPVAGQFGRRLRGGALRLLDITLLRGLLASFATVFLALVALVYIFTLFDVWRITANKTVGSGLILKYLLALFPLISVSLAPACMLIASLATYALLVRRSEAIAWWAAGQSIFRLALPGLFFAAIVGGGVWFVQERVMPRANQRQDALKAQLRGGVAKTEEPLGRQWLATPTGHSIYSYEYDEETGTLVNPQVYFFDPDDVHVQKIMMGKIGSWGPDGKLRIEVVDELDIASAKMAHHENIDLAEIVSPDLFKPSLVKSSYLNYEQLRNYLAHMKQQGVAATNLTVALARKRAEPYGALVMALVGIPLAFSFGRRGAFAALATAIGISLVFLGMISGFQQLGANGFLPPPVAAWAPVSIFGMLGLYLLARSRT
ncbi:MAG: lipopolysaccharide export system permease protein lptG [Blastocatellia bacterium]|jgi:lipopolysaccharide export system permease protein|nr:lipopolysaccharide export system permease protein lptG [Blastocatellia bacterium]